MRNGVIDLRLVALSGNHRYRMVKTLLRDQLTQVCAELKLPESSGRMLSGVLVPFAPLAPIGSEQSFHASFSRLKTKVRLFISSLLSC